MSIIVPNSGSTFPNSGSIPGSRDTWTWIGLQTLTASGSVCYYDTDSGSTAGHEILAISLGAQQSAIFGPYNSPCGLYAAGVGGGCAVVWRKNPQGH